ncbi:hypothetical protein [Sphingobacterium sp. SGR-19]|uniref:hypothetical protein n=1 Tax=Sphingobacterium sp. SGR-19 TaxID=2710886 RepID=UPI0013EBA84B|nr:hypothetical protein [Sphingobacterium sp. SGR-19]NGM64182.1 hypothetical protein [Sphingobacterium sp. SGR-19]
MMNSKPYWYTLLSHFEENRYFTNGLTLPFILGSRSIIEPYLPIQSVEEFFKEVEDLGLYLNLLKCGGIGENVFRIGDVEDIKTYGNKGIFIIPDFIFENCSSAYEIVKQLCDENMPHLRKNEFSKNAGHWGNYSQVELEELNEVRNLVN